MKKPDLPYLIHKRVKGREYWYFQRGGARVRLPAPSDPNFLRAYDDAKVGRRKPPPRKTFVHLIDTYLASPHYRSLKPRTRADYRKVCDYLRDQIGLLDPAKMIRRDVVEAQTANLNRARFANEVVAQLSRLFEFGIDRGWLDRNPAKGVKKVKTGDGHRPWPPALVKAYRGHASGVDLLFFELCLGTGQRAQDVLDMRWSDIEDGGINVRQNKTGTDLWIPFTPRLAELMACTPKEGFWIVTTIGGKQMPYNTIEQRFRVIRKAVGAAGYVIHGLRYTAAHELAQAGCTDAQIAAITGHKSVEMVAKYSRQAGQKSLAAEAQRKRT